MLERVGATFDDLNEWMKDPAFLECFSKALDKEPGYEDAESLLLLAKEIPIFKYYDHIYAWAKHAAALPEKARAQFLLKFSDPTERKAIESKLKQCLSGRFKPGFHTKKDRQIAELICDQSLADRVRARKAGMTLSAFKMRKSAWMKNIASVTSHNSPAPINLPKSKNSVSRILVLVSSCTKSKQKR